MKATTREWNKNGGRSIGHDGETMSASVRVLVVRILATVVVAIILAHTLFEWVVVELLPVDIAERAGDVFYFFLP